MRIGFELYESLNNPGMWKLGMTQFTLFHIVSNVPFREEGNQTYIKNVLHVPTITKNPVSIGEIVDQGMQLHFNDGGCFIEKEGRLIARGGREGQMFILDS